MPTIDAQMSYCVDNRGRKGVQMEFDASELTEEGTKRVVVQLLNGIQEKMNDEDNVIFRAERASLQVHLSPDTKICEAICFFQEIQIKFVNRPGPPNVKVVSGDSSMSASELNHIVKGVRKAAGI
ncbi:MAG: hypothetical protein CBC65_000310 [Rhodothermaceae bacterium TMED105]|nr:MAG: hypothetical protein CBC65_000310 [Rhodothermaceae bacterium TMED105]|tara:strand:+ start:3698 stop:4072 length:375 start_codon:yes stop_codon:yes gene_type:complete